LLDIIITTERLLTDPVGRQLIDYIKSQEAELFQDQAVLYYDFPSYPDYESQIHKPDFLLIAQETGVFPIKYVTDQNLFSGGAASLADADSSLAEFSSILLGRLLRSRMLRASRTELKFTITPILFCPGWYGDQPDELEGELTVSYEGLTEAIRSSNDNSLSPQEFAEVRSIVEGAKAMTRPQRRLIEDPERETKAVALATLEREIANFDEKQRQTALSTVQGPQRIRGLAGSGKTVILAMKAAHLHLSHPTAKILVTFYTRSLRSTLETLITRFYRHYKDEDPDWSYIHIRHGWGSSRRPGVYSDTCKRHQIVPLTLMDAKRKSQDPFQFVCRDLLKRTNIATYYDFVLIDEGQDFQDLL
jgi:superfamily I DNA and RNA helicase